MVIAVYWNCTKNLFKDLHMTYGLVIMILVAFFNEQTYVSNKKKINQSNLSQ